MRICLECGTEIRDGAAFCTACGAPAPAEAYSGASAQSEDASAKTQTDSGFGREAAADGGDKETRIDVPLITLAPQTSPLSRERLIHTGLLVGGVLVVIVLVIGCVFLSSFLATDPLRESSIDGVEDDSYRQCLALVNDLRNDNFDAVIDDIMHMEGDYEDYNFLKKYEELFKEIVPDEGSDEQAVMFRNCCFMVAFTEYTAKKYENYSKDIFGVVYLDDAQQYREWADKLYNDLVNAQSDDQLQAIIDFCAKYDIIHLKQ